VQLVQFNDLTDGTSSPVIRKGDIAATYLDKEFFRADLNILNTGAEEELRVANSHDRQQPLDAVL
jgi:hypothetical protein